MTVDPMHPAAVEFVLVVAIKTSAIYQTVKSVIQASDSTLICSSLHF